MKRTFLVTFALLALPASCVAWMVANTEPREPDPLAGMRWACRHFIEQTLNNPSSAEWVDYLDWPTRERPDGITTVRAEYRAQNAFGGTVREVTFCDIRRDGEDLRLVQFRQ
jgi:hypothetical protein